MAFWERIFGFVRVKAELVSVSELARISWQLGAAPCELEVLASQVLRPLFEHRPEELHDLVVLAAVGVVGDGFEVWDFDILSAASSDLDFLPSEEGQDGQIDDEGHSSFDPLHLLGAFHESGLDSS